VSGSARVLFRDTRIVAPEGQTEQLLDRVLRTAHPGASWAEVRRLVETGKVSVDGEPERNPQRRVRAGARIEISMTARRREQSSVLPRGAFVYVDAHVVVVQKPAGISTVPYKDEPGTLSELVRAELGTPSGTTQRGRREAPLGVVHRIDKETSGLVVFARTLAAKRALKNQFRFHTVHRRYRAIAHGKLERRTFTTRLVPDRGDGRRGSTDNPKLGRVATTHVQVLESLAQASLLECRLETGRTHQIRIQLAEAGHPLLGERVYSKGFRGTLLPAPRLMLHAQELGFNHPETERPLRFEQPMPDDMLAVLAELRRASRR
jgi:23S rRNA pseudouridine1911/1915/1917 synthase